MRDVPEIPESRLYTFMDETREFALTFLEGQRLIHDLALLHAIQGPGFAYFRDVLLRVATHPHSRVAELTPRQWAATVGKQ